jgi:hypothetical protein
MMSSPAEKEEHTVRILTQWEKELEMLEDWLNNPEPEGLPRAVMQREGEPA